MPRLGSARLALLGVLSASSLAGAVYLATHVYRPRPAKAPPQQLVTASITVEQSADFMRPTESLPSGTPIAGVPKGDRFLRSTIIEIRYQTPIDVNRTATIGATLRQELDSVPLVGMPGDWKPDYFAPIRDTDPPRHTDVHALPFAVKLRLEGLGLDWTQQEIPIRKNTPLAVTVGWNARAKAPGEYTLRFPLQDINHAVETNSYGHASDRVVVTVNGVKEEHSGSDDVMMPLSVFQYGVSPRVVDWSRLLGSIFLALFGAGCVTTLLQSWFKRGNGR